MKLTFDKIHHFSSARRMSAQLSYFAGKFRHCLSLTATVLLPAL